jgi:hypothetical protein
MDKQKYMPHTDSSIRKRHWKYRVYLDNLGYYTITSQPWFCWGNYLERIEYKTSSEEFVQGFMMGLLI